MNRLIFIDLVLSKVTCEPERPCKRCTKHKWQCVGWRKESVAEARNALALPCADKAGASVERARNVEGGKNYISEPVVGIMNARQSSFIGGILQCEDSLDPKTTSSKRFSESQQADSSAWQPPTAWMPYDPSEAQSVFLDDLDSAWNDIDFCYLDSFMKESREHS